MSSPWKRLSYRHYLLGLLLVIYAFNWVDRFALGLLLQNIKQDLQLTDTQLGVLTGIAFALFYSVLGLPIARWADRDDRAVVITLSTALWSAALVFTGFATSFSHLLLSRVAVAVGEAGCVPPAQSLIADYFNRSERPRATAIYMLGVPLAAVIGYFGAGVLDSYFGWKLTFLSLGLPGLALAALTWLTLREPRRQLNKAAAGPVRDVVGTVAGGASPGGQPVATVLMALWGNKTFVHVLLCWSLISFFGTGIWQWKPAFFMRTYGLGTADVGIWFASIYSVCAFAGIYIGGEVATRYFGNNERLQFRAIALAYCLFGLVQGAMFAAPNQYFAFALLAVSTAGIYTAHGPVFAAIQSLVPASMRATAVAVIYLFSNLIGLGLGPLAAGVLSDALSARFGQASLRYALLILCTGYLWAAWHIWVAGRTVLRDLESARAAEIATRRPRMPCPQRCPAD